jgi:hypothetical protein
MTLFNIEKIIKLSCSSFELGNVWGRGIDKLITVCLRTRVSEGNERAIVHYYSKLNSKGL